jgi:alkylation response protein AidB-like acyl-CoA dehydrogenase
MDFSFSEEQTLLRNSVQNLLADKYDFDTRRKIVKSADGMSKEIWAQFAEMGLLAAPFSEEQGGFGGGAIETMIVMEEFGRSLVVEPYVETVVLAGGFLREGANADQQAAHIPGIIDGSTVWAFACAEPQGRYNLADLVTTAKKDGGGYTINGYKAVVMGAPWAQKLVVTARTSGGQRDRDGVSLFIVDKSAPGVSTRDYPTVDGRRSPCVGNHFRKRQSRCRRADRCRRQRFGPRRKNHRSGDCRAVGRSGRLHGRVEQGHRRILQDAQAVRRADRQVPGSPAPHGRHVHGL